MSAPEIFRRGSCLLFVCAWISGFCGSPNLQRNYTWLYQGRKYTMQYAFDASSYAYYKGLKRTFGDFAVYVRESPGYKVVPGFTSSLAEIAWKGHFDDLQTVEFVTAFVQNLRYIDDGKYEYPRYPEETLVDGGGDCEDTGILLDALLRALGFDCVLVSPKGHMGVGIAAGNGTFGTSFPYHGKNYYYIETTNTGWGVGDYPDNLSDEALIYDPGLLPAARVLNPGTDLVINSYEKNTSGYANQPVANANKVRNQLANPGNASGNFLYHGQSGGNDRQANTISVDQMVIDGKKETVVTEEMPAGSSRQVVAREK